MIISFILMMASIVNLHQDKKMLCLGDSYTIGESVATNERFPEKTVELLNQKKGHFTSPEIIAKTGWTTKDLLGAIANKNPDDDFDIVTLLIGVNDQFQGKSAESYQSNFELLLKEAIKFAGGRNDRVIVLSIPDYSVTPYASRLGNSQKEIADEIDHFNAINKSIAMQYKVHYIDITEISRLAKNDRDLLANDGLHPSGKMYKEWAEILAEKILSL